MTYEAPLQVIGYGRKSVAEEGSISINAQEAEVRSWCDTRHYTLVAFYHDDGISGATMERPGFLAAMKHLHSLKGEKALVSYALSRLSRSTRDAINLAEALDKKGIALVSVSENIDRTTPHGKFQFELIASLNALEREIARSRTKMAMKELRHQNKRASRHIPYGYDLSEDGAMLMENMEEKVVVARIVKMRKQGVSYKGIASCLTGENIPTKNKGTWAASTILSIVKRQRLA